MTKKFSVMLIAVLIFSLCLTMAFGITAFADNETGKDQTLPGTETISATETENAPAETQEQQTRLSDTSPEEPEDNVQNRGQEAAQSSEGTDSESPKQSVSQEPTMEPAEGEAEEPDGESQESEGTADPTAQTTANPEENPESESTESSATSEAESQDNTSEDNGCTYLVTITDAKGNSVDVTGGAQTLISDVLRNLGYEIGEDAIIEVDPDSVDTDVMNVTSNEEGELVLTDNGPFGKASKNLIVYINGVAIELELVDPTELKGKKTAQQVRDAFGTDAANPLNVKLTGNVSLKDDATITLTAGVHDLYLNGKTLSGLSTATKTMFVIGDGVTLNIYGGSDADDTNGTGSIKGITTLFDVQTGGTLNIYSGTLTSSVITPASNRTGTVDVSGGELNVNGGIIENTGKYSSPDTGVAITVNSGELTVNGGIIRATDYDASYGVWSKGTAVFNGGTVSGSTAIFLGVGSKCTINDVTVTDSYSALYNQSDNLVVYGGNFTAESYALRSFGKANVYGGSFTGKYSLGVTKLNLSSGGISYGIINVYGGGFSGTFSILGGCKINIVGGDFTTLLAPSYIGTLTVAGGTFSSDPGAYLLNGASNWTVDTTTRSGKYIVKANTYNSVHVDSSGVMTGKATVDEFKAAFGTDGTVVMLKDIAAKVTVESGKTITLNLNGKSLTAEYAWSIITVIGDLTLVDSSAEKSGKITDSIPLTNTSFGGGVCVDGGSFTMNGGSISGNKIFSYFSYSYGSAVFVNSGSFTMNGGTISDNTADFGSVFVNNGSFTMNGGTISDNSALYGGGVYSYGPFTMNGGTISDNSASYGGGVYNNGPFTMNGGTIANNNATANGGGIAIDKYSKVLLLGGTITGNKAAFGGGVEGPWTNNCSITLGGSIKITGNTLTDGSTANNLMLYNGYTVNVQDSFSGIVGVSSETLPVEYTPVPVTGQNSADYSGFFSDNDNYAIGNYKNIVYLCIPVVEMDGTKYGFIRNAIELAGNKEKTIKLLSSYTEDLSIGKDKKIILDLNGKFLHGDINVSDNGELTVINESDSYGGVKGHLSKDNGAAIRLTAGVYSEMPNEAFPASGYQIVMNTDPETMDEYPFAVEKRYDIKLVDTTDEGCSAKIKIVGTVASIWVVDKDNKTVAPANVTILEPGRIMQLGAKTAEIRMTDKLIVVLDIKACMCGKSDCVITADNENGVITVRCDGEAVFTADLTDILDKVAKLVYDGETLKAYDADGKLLKEFK